MSGEKRPRHLIGPAADYVVTMPVPEAAEVQVERLMKLLGELAAMEVPEGRVGATRPVRNLFMRHGVAITTKADSDDE